MDINAPLILLRKFTLVFIPLLVAMEPIGLIPVYIGLTRSMGAMERRSVLFYSLLTAALITLLFLIVGKAVFIMLGITISDFQIAGGLVLLSIAISDIVQTARGFPESQPAPGVGIVPIGTPLIAGPAALTTLLILNDLYGFFMTVIALSVNILVIRFVFIWADTVVRYIGTNGVRGISKVISLLLAAIAVMMIRRGLHGFLS